MINQSEISSLKKGAVVNHFLIIKKQEIRNTKQGKPYLTMEFGDKTGSIGANIWDNFSSIAEKYRSGMIVKVSGFIEDYLGTPQLKITGISEPTLKDDVSPSDFLSRSKRDLDEMLQEFTLRIEMIKDTFLKCLMKQIFNKDNMKRFSAAPAGKSWHHSYISGLIEHTLELIKICDLMCDIHPEIHRDLLVCGAMMHDFGKIEELNYDTTFEYSEKGKLIGHIVIAALKLNEECAKIAGFPEELKNCLMHIVLSHQGKLEFASPVLPKTLEAITLYHADELSAKVNAYKNAINNEIKGDARWSKYINLAGTELFKHGLNKEEEKFSTTLFEKI
jgi:3'-5' exoribonuclease